MSIAPEIIALAGSFAWLTAAFLTGFQHQRFPAEYPFIFSGVAAIGALIGVSEFVPEVVDVFFTFTAVSLFFVLPIATVVLLYRRYPPAPERHAAENEHRT